MKATMLALVERSTGVLRAATICPIAGVQRIGVTPGIVDVIAA